MRRTAAVAATWILGTTLPLLAAAIFLLGCCVLPFHGVIHKMLPLCHTAAQLITGNHHEGDPPTTPARQKEEPTRRVVTETVQAFELAAIASAQHIRVSSFASRSRSFMSLGATRCDQDVGLNVLVHTFLI